jgi:two-component system chemotaxis sensor kinase CheA
MVRNSADHGLEPPAERRAAGKPETGRITLAAHHEGGQVIIRLADDGRGLDTGRIRRKALAQGIAGEAALAAMTEAEIHRLIFHAGLSTADAVTAVSGRGVGMDVVKTNLDRIGGTVEVASRAGQGTGFTIRIPLTLAIVAALIVEVAGMRFAIPQLAVGELVRTGGAGDARVERVGDAAVLRLRDRLLPLLPLASLLGLEPPGAAPEGGFVVVVRLGAAAFGLVVDRVHDTEEIVVKPVAPILRHVAAFAGTTILGDGGVVMILDPDGIARQGGLAEPAAAAAAPAPASGPAAARNAALLLFRAGDATPKAVPLGEVARLDDIPVESIEQAAGAAVVQHRGGLLPLLAMEGHAGAPASGRQPVLVLAAAGRGAGLMADAILDVVEQKLALCGGARPGFLGSAIVAGRATDIIDTAWWVARAHPAAPAG